MKLTGKFYKFKCTEILDEDIFPDFIATLINFDKLDNDDKEAIIKSMDFEINKNAVREDKKINFDEELGKPCWKLVDTQGGNLANIESDEFEPGDYNGILDRLDNYYHDYGLYFAYELEHMNVEYEILDEIESI